jgi:hypothetical protein
LKKAYGDQIEELIRMYITHITKVDFLCAFKKAFFTAFIDKTSKEHLPELALYRMIQTGYFLR